MAPATGPSRGSFAGLGIAVSVAAALLLASTANLPLIGSAEPQSFAARSHHHQVAVSEAVDRALCESAPASRDAWPSVEAVRITDVSDEGRRVEVPLVSSCVRFQMNSAQPERSPPTTRSGRVL